MLRIFNKLGLPSTHIIDLPTTSILNLKVNEYDLNCVKTDAISKVADEIMTNIKLMEIENFEI